MRPRWLTEARRIVVLRPEELGDIILTVPMFPVLRRIAPAAELHLVCLPYTAPVARCVDTIDRIHTISSLFAVDELEEHLRRERFDVVFTPHPRSSYAWATVRARIPHRVGPWGRLYSVLYNHHVPRRRKLGLHETVFDLRIIGHLVGEEIPTELVAPALPAEATDSLLRKLEPLGLGPVNRLLIVHPGSGQAERWPPQRFARVAAQLAAEFGLRVVVTGTAREGPLAQSVAAMCTGAISIAGRLELLELMALIRDSAMVLSNSTGPTHIASAYDTPVVAILPYRDRVLWGPINRRGAAVWQPTASKDRTLSGVSEAAVLAEARRVLALPG